jgi:hypothetical protein
MNEEEETFSGIETVIARMKTHPEEFFETQSAGKWRFIFKEYFRDAMTETEKGRLHDALKKVRRMEFDAAVLKELMREEMSHTTEEQQRIVGQQNKPQPRYGTL